MNISTNQPVAKSFIFRRFFINGIFSLAFAISLLINYLSYAEIKELGTANKRVAHTYQVILSASDSLYYFASAESNQRGYLLSGDLKFISRLDDISNNIIAALGQVNKLTFENASQQLRLQRLNQLINQRLTLLQNLIKIKKKSAENIFNIADRDNISLLMQGQNLSEQVNDILTDVRLDELNLLNQRNALLENNATLANTVIIGGNIITDIFLIMVFVLFNFELGKRRQAEKRRVQAEIELTSILHNASDMIAAVDTNYRYINFNPAYQRELEKLFGKKVRIGMSLTEATQKFPNETDRFMAFWAHSLGGHETTRIIEFERNNTIVTFEVTANLIRNQDDKNILGAVHVVRNITSRVQEQAELKKSYEVLNHGMQALQQRNEKITLLVEMSEVMLACSSTAELSDVIAKYCKRILNFVNGVLYTMHSSRNYLESITQWGQPSQRQETFTFDQCWALRMGRLHLVDHIHNQLTCQHSKMHAGQAFPYVCAPLMAQNDIIGLLYLELPPILNPDIELLDSDDRLIIHAVAEQTALSLANLRLRENLQFQSVHDPLTGLYNRRYLEEFMQKVLHQATRTKMPLAVFMLDLDYFKRFNDNNGHEAGNALLKEVGLLLTREIRSGDIAARYGGEEFTIVLYNTEAEFALLRAETIRKSFSQISIQYGAGTLGSVTVSMGMAMFPHDGRTSSQLIEAADKALYAAKKHGRNCVLQYTSPQITVV
jgi:diguanylate cyclase (GGDEF)-like protein/PAS domain S-box-containing protein